MKYLSSVYLAKIFDTKGLLDAFSDDAKKFSEFKTIFSS